MKIYAQLAYPDVGYESEIELAKSLDPETIYEVEKVHMGQSHTLITLTMTDRVYNASQFNFYDEDGKQIDIWNMKEFNPYLD